jgi:uncharacterized membrane protein
MIYSFLGFVLERIINVVFLGYYYDNSVMVGPYQPLYGVGIILAVIIYDLILSKVDNNVIRYSLLIVVAIITTGFSEFIHGEGYELFQGRQLWDYNQTFTCSYAYVCVVPTSLFGFLSALSILFIHPFIKKLVENMPRLFFKWTFRFLLIIFIIDGLYTFFFTLLETF